MIEWRLGRGWSDDELETRLAQVRRLDRNFDVPLEEMTVANGWNEYYSEAVVGQEPPGPPLADGPFERGKAAVEGYLFSDPGIVIGHFDRQEPLLGRPMILELRALRALHFITGVVVGAVRFDEEEDVTVFGFRYDTLEGHIERGNEWFLVTKDHTTGEIRFRIQAAWLPGDFPNWWSRLGFHVFGPSHQRKWHHRAHALLAQLVRVPEVTGEHPGSRRMVHTDPDVVFERFKAKNV
jgi:uncharacterized protein (UPF0548 family)